MVYNNPYKILESDIFRKFEEELDVYFTRGDSECLPNSYIEKSLISSFWGAIGLSGITLCPTVINFVGNRDLKKLSKKILLYQFERIAKGYGIEEELAANICMFSLIGYEMTEYKVNEQSLALVPKFLIRSVSEFSISNAKKSVAKEMDEEEYAVLQFVVYSSLALLCFHYESIGYINTFCKKASFLLIGSLMRNVDSLQFVTYNLEDALESYNATNIKECIDGNIFRHYIKGIPDSQIKQQIELLAVRNTNKVLEDSKQFYESYLYKNQLSKGKSYDKIVEFLKNAYFRYICPSYQYLLDCCGKYYDEMMHLNIESSKWFDINEFDHQLIYLLAAWLKESRNYGEIADKSKSELAEDITNYILSYLNSK